ncbi:DinB family protein [Saccharothrix violaceirubra]|uniref:Putative damage-inducible protein DinB n=1 Tax=Saccharothrix violaceirubra TaxID=413306 RepID=A0A7W7SYQ6_9PSEU|nr:DinB family protein [Saccharothrix violaceirubra]MBB4963310.1 putative damage-inducible protein DinB [Saccharothrix violaceirubra]
MPDFVPPVTDERQALLAYLAKQREGLLATTKGLTDEQLTLAPTVSDLSLAGLLKHAVRTERRWIVAGLAGRPLPDLWPITGWDREFVPDEDVTGLRVAYAEAARETEEIVGALPSLDEPCRLPDARQWSARWVLLHLITETAHHLGHADIVRESIDGAKAADLS